MWVRETREGRGLFRRTGFWRRKDNLVIAAQPYLRLRSWKEPVTSILRIDPSSSREFHREVPAGSGNAAPRPLGPVGDRPCATPMHLVGEGYRLTEIVHYSPAASAGRPHHHSAGQVAIVLQGTVCARGGAEFSTGDIRVDPGGRQGNGLLAVGSPARVVVVELSGSRREELRAVGRGRSESVLLHLEAFEGLAGRFESEFRCRDRGAAMALSGLLIESIGDISRALASGELRLLPPWLRSAVRIVETRWAERLELGDVAAAVGVPSARVAREFRRLRGCSVGEWLRRRRLRAAILPIAASPDPLSAIARDAGFHDASHLSREFRKAWGETPSSFRRDQRERERAR